MFILMSTMYIMFCFACLSGVFTLIHSQSKLVTEGNIADNYVSTSKHAMHTGQQHNHDIAHTVNGLNNAHDQYKGANKVNDATTIASLIIKSYSDNCTIGIHTFTAGMLYVCT